MELFWHNGWLFCVHPDGWGQVYYPSGEPTLSVASSFGRPPDAFPSRQAALDYFGRPGDPYMGRDGRPDNYKCSGCGRPATTEVQCGWSPDPSPGCGQYAPLCEECYAADVAESA